MQECRSMAETVIEVEAVAKRFGSTQALAGVSLAAERGKVLALLGPNGAGKTTLVRILTTLLRPDSGRARVAVYDVVANAGRLRTVIGLAGQYAAVDELLTGRENLELVGLLSRGVHEYDLAANRGGFSRRPSLSAPRADPPNPRGKRRRH